MLIKKILLTLFMIVAVVGLLVNPAVKAADPPGSETCPIVMIGNEVDTKISDPRIAAERIDPVPAAKNKNYKMAGGNKIFETETTVSEPEIVIRS